MSKVCQITGRKRMIGNNVAHSKLRTKRDFSLNLKTIIEKNGLDATLKAAQEKGYVSLV